MGKNRGNKHRSNKKESIKYQVTKTLISKQHFSPKDCKEELKVHKKEEREKIRGKAEELGIPLNQMQLPEIYGKKTFEAYLKQGCRFAEYIQKEHPEIKKLEDCKVHVKEYLEFCKVRGDSAHSLRLYGSALGKVFGCQSAEFKFKFPIRHPENKTRSVTKTKYDEVVERRNAELIEVLKVIGLRRVEAEPLTRDQISLDCTKLTDVLGKGGKLRDVEVLNPEILKKYMETHPRQDNLLFGKIEKNVDVHSFRYDYADALYKKYLSEKYEKGGKTTDWYIRHDGSGRRYDRDVALIVSNNLGHERVDTAIISYLK